MSDIQVTSHAGAVKREVEQKMKQAARMIGGTLEGHAKEYCPVDTGLLRNSITFAIGGEGANNTVYTSNERNKSGETVAQKTGVYEGTAPKDTGDQVSIYVGTNVQYAPYQELGAPNINLPARPFIRPAVDNHKDEIEQILHQVLGDI